MGAAPLGVEESVAFAEGWIARHAPGLEGDWLDRMRQFRWRPLRTASGLVRGMRRLLSRAPDSA